MNQQPDPRFKNNQPTSAKEQPLKQSPQALPEFEAKLWKKRHHKKRKLKKQLIIVVAVLLIFSLFFFTPLFKIKRVTIRGIYNGNLSAVEEKAREQIGKHYLFYGKNAIITSLKQDPYVESVEIDAGANGDMELQVHEYAADYVLLKNGTVYTLNRDGRVLGTSSTTPAGVTELIDDTTVLAPGNIMYAEGIKKTIMIDFRKLMTQNTSLIEFEKLNIQNPADITLEYKGWTVELGNGEKFQAKVNQAINILKSVDPEDGPKIIDLKFDAPPVIRQKGGV